MWQVGSENVLAVLGPSCLLCMLSSQHCRCSLCIVFFVMVEPHLHMLTAHVSTCIMFLLFIFLLNNPNTDCTHICNLFWFSRTFKTRSLRHFLKERPQSANIIAFFLYDICYFGQTHISDIFAPYKAVIAKGNPADIEQRDLPIGVDFVSTWWM